MILSLGTFAWTDRVHQCGALHYANNKVPQPFVEYAIHITDDYVILETIHGSSNGPKESTTTFMAYFDSGEDVQLFIANGLTAHVLTQFQGVKAVEKVILADGKGLFAHCN